MNRICENEQCLKKSTVCDIHKNCIDFSDEQKYLYYAIDNMFFQSLLKNHLCLSNN